MKILVIRFSSIGDIVLTSPIVRCIKLQLNADIHFLTKKSYSSVVASNPHISKVHTIQKEASEVVEELKQEHFDTVIDLHKNIRSKQLIKALNISFHSFDKLNVKKWLFVNTKLNLLPNNHVVDRYFQAVHTLGVSNDQNGLDYFIPAKVEQALADKIKLPESYTSIAIGGTYGTKKPSAELVLSVIKRLKNAIVLLGGNSDVEQASAILSQCTDLSVIDLTGKLSLEESALVVKNGTSLVSGDTGMMHIAAALKCPLNVIWGNTHPSFGFAPYVLNESLATNHAVDIACRPCSKLGYDACPRGHFKCMKHDIEQIVKNCNSHITPQ